MRSDISAVPQLFVVFHRHVRSGCLCRFFVLRLCPLPRICNEALIHMSYMFMRLHHAWQLYLLPRILHLCVLPRIIITATCACSGVSDRFT